MLPHDTKEPLRPLVTSSLQTSPHSYCDSVPSEKVCHVGEILIFFHISCLVSSLMVKKLVCKTRSSRFDSRLISALSFEKQQLKLLKVRSSENYSHGSSALSYSVLLGTSL